ncbi:MAG: DMT family transporter [Longimicrobiales bacterium]
MATARDPNPAPSARLTPRQSDTRATYALLLLLVLLWAVNFSVIKVALEDLEPMAFNPLRFLLASVVVWAVLRRRGRVPLPARADLPRIIALGIIGNVVYQLLFIHAMDHTRAGNASLLLAGTPMLTALLSAALGHERVRPLMWLGVSATVAGMVLVVVGSAAELGIDSDTLRGDLLMIAASAAWAMYTVGARAPIRRYGSVAVTAWTMWIGTAGLFLLGIPWLLALGIDRIGEGTWLAVLYSGAFGIGVAYMLWYHGVRTIGNTRTASYSNLVPVFALAIAWAWLDEVPTPTQLIGAAVIIGGVTLANTPATARAESDRRRGSSAEP